MYNTRHTINYAGFDRYPVIADYAGRKVALPYQVQLQPATLSPYLQMRTYSDYRYVGSKQLQLGSCGQQVKQQQSRNGALVGCMHPQAEIQWRCSCGSGE
jgi:hypothetical protein